MRANRPTPIRLTSPGRFAKSSRIAVEGRSGLVAAGHLTPKGRDGVHLAVSGNVLETATEAALLIFGLCSKLLRGGGRWQLESRYPTRPRGVESWLVPVPACDRDGLWPWAMTARAVGDGLYCVSSIGCWELGACARRRSDKEAGGEQGVSQSMNVRQVPTTRSVARYKAEQYGGSEQAWKTGSGLVMGCSHPQLLVWPPEDRALGGPWAPANQASSAPSQGGIVRWAASSVLRYKSPIAFFCAPSSMPHLAQLTGPSSPSRPGPSC